MRTENLNSALQNYALLEKKTDREALLNDFH